MKTAVTWDGLNEALLGCAKRDGTVPISGLPGLYHRKVDAKWEFWLNGRPLQLPVAERKGLALYPGELYVEYQGWPFAVIDCATGEGYAGDGAVANLAAFIAALREASR
jgi:hypothetical protein